jgi:predicted AAA+ superfamily ATPase
MYINRKIEVELNKYLNTKEILALIGPRQSGKTTVLKKIFNEISLDSKASFISFEDRDVLSLFNENIKNFAETYLKNNDFLFIDEFQYAKEGGKNLKYLFDVFDTKIIISGSSAIDLTINTLKFLVGRVFVLEMKQFDFEEFLLAKDENYYRLYLENKINFLEDKKKRKKSLLVNTQKKVLKNYFEEYAVWGGYPRVVLANSIEEKKIILKNIYNTYFLREVQTMIDLADDYQLERVIKLLSLQIGNLVEYDNLGNETDLSFVTIKKYVNFLEKTYICKLVKPFYKNKRKEIVKIPKIFFFDTGLRNVIVNDFRMLNDRVDAGELLENAVWMQLNRKGFKVQYWRDKNKNEIDLILDLSPEKIVAIEIKKDIRRCKRCPEVFAKEYDVAEMYCGYLKQSKKFLKKDNKTENNIFVPLI